MEPEGVLVGAGSALLVGVRGHKGGVQVHHQQPVHPRASLPGPPPGLRPGQPQPGQASLAALGEALDDPPGGRDRGHRAEQPGLIPKRGQVAQAIPTIGEHDRQVSQHLAGSVPRPAWLSWARPAVEVGR
jgi:hypothetical protein